MISPLLYIWGDDELAAERLIQRFAAALAKELGAPLERWDLKGELATAAAGAGQVRERLATGVMFGGGTLVVLTKPGALMRRNDTRDVVVAAIRDIAPGNALVVVDGTEKAGNKGPGVKSLSKAVTDNGGRVVQAMAPRPSGLATWLETEARERGIALDRGAARELADRLGSRVTDGDVDRRHLSRIASNELEKVALRHALDGGPVTVADVQALVAETTPGSIWGLTDAVGARRPDYAIQVLDRLYADSMPEPVILTMLHRRIRDLIAVGSRLAAGETPADVLAESKMHPFVAEKLRTMARGWTTDALARAVAGLVELDAMAKGAPGYRAEPEQRQLALTLWIREHATPDGAAGRRDGNS